MTSIGDGAFASCSSLTSFEIPNSVGKIGDQAFLLCSNLVSVTLGSNVQSIGVGAFASCSSLTSIEIPNSVKSIGYSAFSNCTALASVSLGNSLVSIGDFAFYSCIMPSIEIPRSVKSIGYGAFYTPDLMTVVSLSKTPAEIVQNEPTSNVDPFSKATYTNGTLYVPKGTLENYKKVRDWSAFKHIEEMEDPAPKCETPTVQYKDGKLYFECATEGVQYHIDIIGFSIDVTNEHVDFPKTFTIKVYAYKDEYDNSDEVTTTITVSRQTTDVNGDGSVDTQDVLEIYQYIQEH